MKSMYSPSRELSLEVVSVSNDGQPVSGWVINGAWWWKRSEELNAELACRDRNSEHSPVTTMPLGKQDWEVEE